MASLKDWVDLQARRFTTDRFGVSQQRADGGMGELNPYLPTIGSSILDVGCCDGGVVAKLREMGYEAAGADLPTVIDRARQEHPERAGWLVSINLEFGEAVFWDDTFDLILATEVIEHLLHDYEFLRRLHQWLKPGGSLFLTTRFGGDPEAHHVRHYEPGSLQKLLHYAGFDEVRVEREVSTLRATGRKPNAG